ncbi:MAG: FkbM family methyltransferase [Tistlia sp.]|uniref:FkbM family methyltransferase n=1 Tax=Tistlia sp. TaxID=3057121 RepID=UPI0034A44AE6
MQTEPIHERALKTIYYGVLDRMAGRRGLSRFVPVGLEPFCDITKRLPHDGFRMVFDVGANVGKMTRRFGRLLPDAQVHAFEPVGETYDTLRRQTARLPNVTCVQAALGAEEAKVDIVLQRHSAVNSLRHAGAPANGRPVETIKVTTLNRYCEDRSIEHINYLKIDAEGTDMDVLRGGRRMLDDGHVDFVQAEVGFDADNPALVPFSTCYNYFADRGYLLFGLYHQTLEWSGRPYLHFCDAVFVAERIAGRSAKPRAKAVELEHQERRRTG